jgi:hypothetical protein
MTSRALLVGKHSRETICSGIVLNMADATEKKFTGDIYIYFFFFLSGKLESL